MDTLVVNQHFSEKTKRQKILRTISLIFVWACMGLFVEITGPTLLDLKLRVGANYEEIADAVAGQNIGFFIGSAIGGVLVDRFVGFCDLMVGVSLSGAAVATLFVPLVPVVRLVWLCIVLQGISEGIIDVAGQKLLLMMWQEKSPSPLNLLHGGFGIGAFIIPLIANPFLAVVKKDPTSNITSRMLVNSSRDESSIGGYLSEQYTRSPYITLQNENETRESISDRLEFLKESRIEFAYLIAAIIVMTLSVVFYVYQVKDVRAIRMRCLVQTRSNHVQSLEKPLNKLKDMVNPATCANGNFLYGVAVFSVLFLYYFNLVGGERIIGKFLRAYSIEQLGFSVDEGSYVNTSFWVSFAVGRLVGFIAARWIPIRILILIETGGILTFSVLLNIFSVNNPLAFWILLQPFAVFIAPTFPSGVGWGNHHVVMTGMALCLLLFGASLGGIAYLRLTGYLFETVGPRAFLYHVMGMGIAAFLLAVILDLVGATNGSRFNNIEVNTEETELDSLNETNRVTDNTTI